MYRFPLAREDGKRKTINLQQENEYQHINYGSKVQRVFQTEIPRKNVMLSFYLFSGKKKKRRFRGLRTFVVTHQMGLTRERGIYKNNVSATIFFAIKWRKMAFLKMFIHGGSKKGSWKIPTFRILERIDAGDPF